MARKAPANSKNKAPAKKATANKKPAPSKAAANKRAASARKAQTADNSLKKQFLKSREACKVTFRFPAAGAAGAKTATVVGDFNGWDTGAAPMRRLKDGSFSVTLEIPQGRKYCFRFLLDGKRWENHWHADEYLPNEFGTEDSVLVL